MNARWIRAARGIGIYAVCLLLLDISAFGIETKEPPSILRLVSDFDPDKFAAPDSVYWPGYFWLWNAPLEPEIIRTQLRDMASHGAKSVCMLPMPHAFRPDSTNNSMTPDYLTPEYFERVRFAVSEAAALGMHWWLYDEGGWPSGQALGKVAQDRPELRQQRLVRERIAAGESYRVPGDSAGLVVEATPPAYIPPGEVWTPERAEDAAWLYRVSSGGYVDLLNPETTARFIELTHEAYRSSLRGFIGKNVFFTFTDEPNAPNLAPEKSIAWTPGMEKLFRDRYGVPIFDLLPALFRAPTKNVSSSAARARIDFYDLWTNRFRQAYFDPIRDWCHRAGLGSGGHLNGEDETINAVRYGFGHALRQLRAMDVPGVDLIWRQLFPGKTPQHFFPKYASSAAHQNGTRLSFTESFCVYGNGLTPAQMKWLIDYQYARGVNLLVAGCYPLSTRDHHMTGERPHFGVCNPLWDHLPAFHAYTARLGYALSAGAPKISTALYYPVRDLWAYGTEAAGAVETHDRLANELLAHQCDFDLIDDDLLCSGSTRIENGELAAGAMRYRTIVCGEVRWMHPQALARLQEFAAAGGTVFCANFLPGTEGVPGGDRSPSIAVDTVEKIAARVRPDIQLHPANRDIRVTVRTIDGGEIFFLFNEGNSPYDGALSLDAESLYRLDTAAGLMTQRPENDRNAEIHLLAGESLLLLASKQKMAAKPQAAVAENGMQLDASIRVRPYRRFIAGERDFEILTYRGESQGWGSYAGRPLPFSEAGRWKDWLGEDFSGEADYEAEFDLPDSWAGVPLVLETGPVEYAATVFLDGKNVGSLLWSPWRVELPPVPAGTHRLLIRVANTLANELTSKRTIDAWSKKSGPGWPSPYHERTLVFERESRGGGLSGAIRLYRP